MAGSPDPTSRQPVEPQAERVEAGAVRAGGPRPVALVTASGRSQGELGPRNPAVAAALQDKPVLAARASAQGPAPTLFAAGDLPDFTASGIDPKALLRVPWNARQSLAAEPNQARVYEAIEKFNGVNADDAELVAVDLVLAGDSVREYQRRVDAWLAAAQTPEELWASLGYAGATGDVTNPARR